MKLVYMFGIGVLLSASLAASAQQSSTQPSLADQARAATRNKPAEHAKVVFDNDNIPSSGGISVLGDASASAPAAADSGKKGDKSASKSSVASQQKEADAIKSKIEDQKKEITQLERELDVTQREWKLRQAAFYADAGNQFRDQKKWADDEHRYNDEVAAKKQAVDSAHQKLDDLQEQARKAGLSSSATE